MASWMINPQSRSGLVYMTFMVALTFINLFTIPLDMAFAHDIHHAHYNEIWIAFNVLSDVVFILDIALNFRTGIMRANDQMPILDPQKVKQLYIRSWFFPDLVAAFPSDIVILIVERYYIDTDSLSASKMLKLLMFARILSILRVIRLTKLFRFFLQKKMLSYIPIASIRKTVKLVSIGLTVILTVHWNACIQYFISEMEEFPIDSWVVQDELEDATVGEKYSSAFFRAICQMAWTSYRSLQPPIRTTEQWSAIASMVAGRLILMAAAFWIVALAACKTKKAEERAFLKVLEPLPQLLRKRVVDAYRWQQKKNSLGLLTKSLRKDVMKVMCPNLMKSRLFASVDATMLQTILMALECEIFWAGDVIVYHNTPVEKMYFIESGCVLRESPFFKDNLSCGEYFGGMVLGGLQPATVCALSDSRIFSLSLEKLQEIEMDISDVLKEMRERERKEAFAVSEQLE